MSNGMLVLTRKENEKVLITVPPSDQPTVIEHTTVRIRGEFVRQGFIAPRCVEIHRKEVADAIARGEKPGEKPKSAG